MESQNSMAMNQSCVDVLRGIIWMLDGGADHIFWDDNLRVDLIGDPKIASLSTWIGP